jgi:uncharacterized protein (DUF169 family)
MDKVFNKDFIRRWKKYFGRAEEPLCFFYSGDERYARFLDRERKAREFRCLIHALRRVRAGEILAFDGQTIGCPGGLRYAGFSRMLRPDFKYFLSCGIPGKMAGERYKKTPELVEAMLQGVPTPEAEGKRLVFKPWAKMDENETPRVVVFFAPADALSGLFTLANYRRAEEPGVFCPFGAGCGSIIGHPLAEARTPRPRAVLGLFDPSARPHVEPELLTFAIPWALFLEMNEDMEESFLITPTWKRIRRRLATR